MRKLFAALVTLVFLSTSIFAGIPLSAAAAATNCSAANTFNFTQWGGVPNGFNHLTSNIPGSAAYYMEYQTLYPPPNPEGASDWGQSVLDWYTYNSNYTIWKMNVKPGLTWSNGQPVTSQDIINTMGPGFALNQAYDYVNAHTEVAKEFTVNASEAEFVLNVSDAHFIQRISDPTFVGIFPQQAISIGPNFTGIGITTVGSGPYYVTNYSSGSTQVELLRNPYYKPTPGPCKVVISYVETTSNSPTLLASGASDLALVASSDVAPLLQENSNLHMALVAGHYITNMRYNVTYYPYNMTQFRQALVYGINETALLSAFGGYGSTAYSAQGTLPSFDAYYTPHQMNYSYSPSTAISLLNSIGIKKGSDGYLQFPNGTDITLPIIADTTISGDPVVAQLIQSQLESIGFKVTVNTAGLGAMIGGSYSNANNEQHSILLDSSLGSDIGDSFLDAQPGYLGNWIAFVPGSTWESPPSAQKEFQGNSSIVTGTDNATAIQKALDNIQSIDSNYLPVIILGYPDQTWVYSTKNWKNWGTGPGAIIVDSAQLNMTTIEGLQPASGASATTSTSSAASVGGSSSASASASSSSAAAGSSSATASTNTTSTSSSNSFDVLAAAAIVIIIVVGAGAYFALRRRGKT